MALRLWVRRIRRAISEAVLSEHRPPRSQIGTSSEAAERTWQTVGFGFFPRRSLQNSARTADSADSSDPTLELQTTGEHPFWLVGAKRFVETKHLKSGDRLRLSNGGLAEVTSNEPQYRN